MSLTEISLATAVRKQYNFKIKANMGLFLTLMALQVMAILFSLAGVQTMSMGTSGVMVSVKGFSADIIIVFSSFWAFIMATTFTTMDQRNMDFAFVSNRLSSNLANIGFLLTAGMVGGLTAILGGALLRVITFFSLGSEFILRQHFFISPRELVARIAVVTLYLVLLSSMGYFCGMLVQFRKVFIVILPAVFVAISFLDARSSQSGIVNTAVNFFLAESSLAILAIKIILTVGLLLACAVLVSDRLEVRE